MKYPVIFLFALVLAAPLFGQQEAGGLEKVRLHVLNYIVREPASSSIPAFNFQNGADTWIGNEITTTTDTTDVVDQAALNTCANTALQQSQSACFYPELQIRDYLCGGWDGGWCTEYWYEWVQIPGCVDQQQEQIVQEINDGTHPCVINNTSAYPLALNNHYLLVEPGVDYTLDITSLSDVNLRTSLMVSPGYVVFIENSSGDYEPLSMVDTDFATATQSITFQLRELRAGAPALFGQASDLYIGDVKWELGLGTLGNGDPAGRLVLHEDDLTAETYTRETLKYYRPVTAGVGEIDIVEDSSGFLRQIRTPRSFADIVDVASDGGAVIQYEIRLYAPLATNATKTGGLYTPVSADLLVTYRLGREAAQGLDQFFIKQFDASGSEIRADALTKFDTGLATQAGVPLVNWQVNTASTSGAHDVSKTLTIFNVEQFAGFRTQQLIYQQPKRLYDEEAANFRTESTFELAPDLGLGDIGELLRLEIRGDDASGSLEGSSFNYYYSLDPSLPQNYGQRFLSIDHFGGWTYTIHNSTESSRAFGEESVIIRSGDEAFNPATFNNGVFVDHDNDPNTDDIRQWEAELITTSNAQSKFDIITQTLDYDGVSVRNASVTTNINDSGPSSLNTVSESVQSPTFGDYGTENIEVVCAYKPYDFPKASNRRNATFSAMYTPNTANRRLIGKPVFVFRPDRTKTSYGYYEGSYRGLSDVFVSIEINGYNTTDLSHSDTENVTIADQTHGSTSASHEGMNFTIDALTLAPGQSTKSVIARDVNGRVRYIERWAYTTGAQWEKFEDIAQSFTKFGQLVNKTLNGRIVYEANWVGLRKQWEKDEAGLKTTFEYDGIGRITSVIKEGVSGISGIPDTRRSNFYYDARDRVVVTETVVGSSEKLVEKKIYDAEGYLLSETNANGLTTNYTYEYEASLYPQFLGMKKTATYSDDTYLVTYVKQNGELWKEAFYSASDQLIQETLYTHTDNVSAPSGSGLESANRKVRVDTSDADAGTTDEPYVERFYDAAGNLRFEQSPSAVAGNPFQRLTDYDSDTGQMVAQLETEVANGATTGALGLKSIMDYGLMGEVVLQGIDVDGDGDLTKASADRISQATDRFILDGGNLWLGSTQIGYPEDSEDNPFEITAKTQLSGLSASTMSYATSEDLAGNETTTTITVNRTANTITTTVNHPDSDTDAITVLQNGLTQSSTSKENLQTTFGYDQAGRQILATDARGISAVTKYEANKDRPEYLIGAITATVTGTEDASTLAAQGYATQYAYEADTGRVSWEKNPDGKYTRYSYEARGLVEYRWGDATYPVRFQYDGFGQLEKQHTFGMANLPTGVDFTAATWPTTAGDGNVTTFDYFNSAGLLKSRTDALNRETSFTYDVRSRLVTKVTPDGGATDPAITTTRAYFAKTDELESVTYSGDGDLTPDLAFTYYRSGDTATVSEDGVSRTFQFDFNSGSNNHTDLRLLSENLPSYYTAISSLATNDSGHEQERMHYKYQSTGARLGRLQKASIGTANSGNSYTLGAEHHATSYDYDSKGRFNAVDVTTSRTWTYTYFVNTNQIGGRTLSGASLEVQRDYEDDRNLLSSIETLDDVTSIARFAYRYNDLGNREDAVQTGSAYGVYDEGLVIDYGYNDRMEVTRFDSVTGSSASVLDGSPLLISGRSFDFDYDSIGNRSSVTHKNVKLDGSTADHQFTWSANELNQMDARGNADFVHVQGTSILESYVTVGFVPDDLNRALRYGEFFSGSIALRDGTTAAAVHADDLDVFSVQPDGWIDSGDGVTVLGDLIDHQQREVWLPPTAENFVYDVRGNLKSDSRWEYTWDGADRLRSIETNSIALAAGVAHEKFGYRYDYQGRRIAKDVYAWTGAAYEPNPSQTTLYYYDGWNLIYEATYSGITYAGSVPTAATFESEIAYHWGLDWSTSLQGAGGVGGLVAIQFRDAGGTAEIRYPGFDGNGNLVVLLDDTGTITATYEYGPYGELWRASGADAARNPFRFSTKYNDAETKLYYYGYRYYSPDYGRFISQDPIRESGGLNIYAFVNNNPTNYYDYLGMVSVNFSGSFSSSFGGSGSVFGNTSSYTYDDPVFSSFATETNFFSTYDYFGENYAPFRSSLPPSLSLYTQPLVPINNFSNFDLPGFHSSYSRYNQQTAESVYSSGIAAGVASYVIDGTVGMGRIAELTPVGLLYGKLGFTPFSDITNSVKGDVVGFFLEEAIIDSDGDWSYYSSDYSLGFDTGEAYSQLTEAGVGLLTLGGSYAYTGTKRATSLTLDTLSHVDDSSNYLYRTISTADPHYAQFADVGEMGSIFPRGGHNDLTRHVQFNETDSVFTSWSRNQSANWTQWADEGSIQLRMNARTLDNPALDVSRWSNYPWEEEVSVIGDIINTVERVR
jgi:RHS repeat-associated protein